MGGFTRRFASTPSLAEIGKIEGTVIVDNPQPAAPNPVGSGVSAIVGEFPDCSTSVQVDAAGAVTVNYTPVEVFGETDIQNQFGDWDATLGDFGVTEGSGYVARFGKSFPRLILCAINIASARASRVYRKLPTNKSAVAANPAQPMQGGIAVAGYEFKSGANRIRTAQKVVFLSTPAFFQENGTGSVTNAGAAAVQNLTGSGGFSTALRPDGTRGVQVGDIVVIGQVGGAGALGANADTYRVQAVTSDTVLALERMDGSNFSFTTDAAVVYRIHWAADADTGGQVNLANVDGFNVPVRPMDATIDASTSCAPTIVPAAIAQNSSDPLSGLTLLTHSGGTTVYTAALQGANAGQSATMDAEYVNAINAFLGDGLPQRDVNLMTSARTSATIRTALSTFSQQRKANGIGLMVSTSPEVNVVSLQTAGQDASPGVGATRQEEVTYRWPGVRVLIPKAVGTGIKTALGTLTYDGILDTRFAPFDMALMAGLPPHRSPAQSADPVPQLLSAIVGLQRGLPALGIDEYAYMKARGFSGPRINPTTGTPELMSEVTSSLDPAKLYVHRRRKAFQIQDTLALALADFKDQPVTEQFKADVLSIHHHVLDGMLSPNAPQLAEIAGYALDDQSGNTPAAVAAGAYFVSHFVELLSIAHNIVVQSTVGNGVLSISTF